MTLCSAWRARVAALAVTLGLLGGLAFAQDQRAVLTAIVNQVERSEALVMLRQGDVLIGVATLEQLGIHRFDGRRESIGGVPFVSLASLSSVLTYEVNERQLTLRLVVHPELLESSSRSLASGRPANVEYRHDTSAFLNYSVNLRNASAYDAFAETGVSTRAAFVGSTLSFGSDAAPVRGLSSATFDQPDRLRRIVVGDTFASGGLLGGGVLIGGAMISREYSVDPYFVRYPAFNLSGAVTTPSTVEVYVNDRLVRTEQLPPGAFDLTRLPTTTGPNDARLVIRDAFGGTRELAASYYLTTSVLAKGLQEYQYAVGVERTNFGIDSFNYGTPVLIGRHRLGLTDAVTLGGRVEARSDLVSAGPSVTVRTPFGEIEAAAATSRTNGIGGSAVSGAYAYTGRRMSLGIAARAMTERYATSSLHAIDDRPRTDLNGYISVQAGSRTSVTVQRRDAAAYAAGAGTRTAVITSTRINRRTDVFVTAAQSRGVGLAGRELFVGASIRLTANAIASVSAERTATGDHVVTEVQQPLPVGQGWGYRLHAENGSQTYSSGAVQYQGPYGRYEIRRDTINGVGETVVSASGGIVAIDGGVFPSRPVQDGFALVRVPDVAGVRTYASNQEVGRTDSHGNLLVPNLLSYYGHILNISDQDVPFDHAIDGVRRTIAPPYRGGALVVFPVQPRQGVTGRIALDVGGRSVVPAYGELTVKDDGATSPVGEHGEFYFERLAAGRHEALLRYESIACTLTLDVPNVGAPVIDLGAVLCSVPAR